MSEPERSSLLPPDAPSLPADLEKVLVRLKNGLKDLYGGRYRGLVLCGSYARGEGHDESDVDLLLLLEGKVDRYREVVRTEPVKWPLFLESGYVLSVVPVGAEEFRSSREPFLWNAREEGVILHEGPDANPPPKGCGTEHG